jgi:cyclic pyranopterin phosphate synthase
LRIGRWAATIGDLDDRSLTMLDTLGRPMRDLRVSVTDRCNFRCTYCMPKEAFGPDHAFLPRTEILDYEEIERVVRAAVRLGVRKVRLTGGEPLVRRGLERLVAMLATVDGVDDLTLTTNGSLLASKAEALAEAGLDRVTVSLDANDDPTFKAMNDVRFPVARVLEGVATAEAAGLGPIKVNTVVRRGVNEHAVLDLADRFRGTDTVVRFIEYMDVGHTNGWRGRAALSIPRRGGRDRPHRQRQPAVLRRLHAGAAVGRRATLHVPLRDQRPRPAWPSAWRRGRRRARRSAA